MSPDQLWQFGAAAAAARDLAETPTAVAEWRAFLHTALTQPPHQPSPGDSASPARSITRNADVVKVANAVLPGAALGDIVELRDARLRSDGLSVARADLRGVRWANVAASGVDFSRALLGGSGASFDDCEFRHCTFDGAVLADATLGASTKFVRCSFRQASLQRLLVRAAHLRGAGGVTGLPWVFVDCDFDLADIEGVTLATADGLGSVAALFRHPQNWATCRRRGLVVCQA